MFREKVNNRRGTNLRKFGTFPHALSNVTTNKLLLNDKVTAFF